MFTGIIQTMGTVAALHRTGADDLRLRIQSDALDWTDVKLGDSLAVSGVCLTVIDVSANGFMADVSAETLQRTTLGDLLAGQNVNLEKSLTPASRLGGHLVSGHVDGIGEVVARDEDGRSVRLRLRAPDALAKFIAEKGSICVDGVSLTVNAVDGAQFDLNIVPHTLGVTTLGAYVVGTRANLEVDLIARYLERLLLGEQAAQPAKSTITREFLARHGFIKQEE